MADKEEQKLYCLNTNHLYHHSHAAVEINFLCVSVSYAELL